MPVPSKPSRTTLVTPELGSDPAIALGELYSLSDLEAWKFSDENIVDQADGLMAWWVAQVKCDSPVARMALDVLSSPASSVDAERAFSGGRMAVNYQQHRMGLDTFRAKMAIGSWYGTPLLQDLEEVLGDLEGRRTTVPDPLNI